MRYLSPFFPFILSTYHLLDPSLPSSDLPSSDIIADSIEAVSPSLDYNFTGSAENRWLEEH